MGLLLTAACGGSSAVHPGSSALSAERLQSAIASSGGRLTGLTVRGGVAVARLTVGVGGGTAQGWVAWPTTVALRSLVLYAHGCCGVPADAAATTLTLEKTVRSLIVAMDYRDADAYAPDLAALDLAAADRLVRKAIPGLVRTVAVGVSEGGAVTGLMIAANPGLVDSWVDIAGAVDLGRVATQLLATQAMPDGGGNESEVTALLGLLAQSVGDPPDQARVRALSPGLDVHQLRGLRQAVIVHASGDLIVPAQESVDLAEALRGEGVDTRLRLVDPAEGQPTESVGWHAAPPVEQIGLAAAATLAAGGTVSKPDLVRSTASLG